MSDNLIQQLIAIFVPLSLIAVGGGLTVVPDIHLQVVEIRGWMTSAEFAELFTLAQVAPGPNILIVSLVGWKVAGWLGAVMALVAFCLPSSLLTYAVVRAWGGLSRSPLIIAIKTGLVPIAIGLVLSSGLVLGQAAVTTWLGLLVTAATIVLVLRTNLHPLILMVVAAGMGVAGWL